MPHKGFKIFGYIFLSIVLIFIAVFLYFFIYYLWQFKYGSPETVTNINKVFSDTFTKANQNNKAPVSVPDTASLIHAHNPQLGKEDASVTMIMFIDFECPFCQASFPVFKQIVDTFGDAVHIVFKHYPIESIHPHAYRAAEASMCAEEQDKFWEFHDQIFATKKLDETSLYTHAIGVGINAATFDQCMKAGSHSSEIDTDLSDGIKIGIRGTPTYIVNGQVIEGSRTIEEWKQIILAELNKKN